MLKYSVQHIPYTDVFNDLIVFEAETEIKVMARNENRSHKWTFDDANFFLLLANTEI